MPTREHRAVSAGLKEYFKWKDASDGSPSSLVHAIIDAAVMELLRSKRRYLKRLVRRVIKNLNNVQGIDNETTNILNEIDEELNDFSD